VSTRVEIQFLKDGLDGLLGRLMAGECRPVEIPSVTRVVRVAQIRFGLSEPVLRSLRIRDSCSSIID